MILILRDGREPTRPTYRSTSTVITLQSYIENLTTQALQIPQSVMRGYRPIHQVSVTL